jgi:adenosine deaminase
MGPESFGPVSDLPLIDLHRHLDGNVRLATILELARQNGIELPGDSVEALRPHVQVLGVEPDLVTWLAKLSWMTRVLVDCDACARIAYENVLDAADEGLDYVELRFSPYFMAEPNDLDPAAVVEAVIAGIARGREETGLPVQLIGILSRTFGPQAARVELDALLTQRDSIVALDLAGDEKAWPPELFVEHFARGRDAGWQITVHAGEAGDALCVRAAIDQLGARRIGHGIRAIDDPGLIDLLGERGIGLEINLTSNLQTSSVASLAEHPMKAFLERGLLATLNTDDPVISGIDLRHEYEVAAPAAGLTPAQIRQAQANALEIAFLSREEKETLRRAKLPAGPQP